MIKDQSPVINRNFSWIATIVSIILVILIFSAIIVREPKRDGVRATPSAAAEAAVESGAAEAESAAGTDESNADADVIPAATYVPARLSHLDPEYFENQTETNGIIIGGTVIAVLIFLSILVLLILERIRDTEVHER